MTSPLIDKANHTNDPRLSHESDDLKNCSPDEQKQKAFHLLSSDEHLQEARNALEDGYRIDTDPLKTVWGRLNDAKRHLKAIGPQTPQYIAAKGLTDEVILRKKQMHDTCERAVYQYMVNQRETMVYQLEQYFVNKGIYAEIELNGIDKKTLRVCSSVFRATSISKIAYETAFFSHLRKAGFTSIVFDNNEGKVTVYKLESK
jgi:hypothetical protein